MQEWNEQQVMALIDDEEANCVVFLHTPMCGTCQAAKKMLDVLQVMDADLKIYMCNMNIAPDLAQSWKIESVPCILPIYRGKIMEKIYAVQSVPALYEKFVRHGLMSAR